MSRIERTTMPTGTQQSSTDKPRKRDANATRQRILNAARADFAEHGLTGARIERIARTSDANVQMIYRYFGSKEDLYMAALADIYAHIRERERNLDISSHAPVEGVRRLIEFTFDYLNDNPEFVAIIRNENGQGGQFVSRLPMISDSTQSLIEAIGDLLSRGYASGDFKRDMEAKHLYVAILSLCMVHQAQRSTLSVMLREDLGSDKWLASQRQIAIDMILSFLAG